MSQPAMVVLVAVPGLVIGVVGLVVGVAAVGTVGVVPGMARAIECVGPVFVVFVLVVAIMIVVSHEYLLFGRSCFFHYGHKFTNVNSCDKVKWLMVTIIWFNVCISLLAGKMVPINMKMRMSAYQIAGSLAIDRCRLRPPG